MASTSPPASVGSQPDLSESPAIDVHKPLEARALPAAQALRTWLRTADGLDDAEIRESFNNVQEAMARAVRSTGGKVVRFGITTAAGFIPDCGSAFELPANVGEPGHASRKQALVPFRDAEIGLKRPTL